MGSSVTIQYLITVGFEDFRFSSSEINLLFVTKVRYLIAVRIENYPEIIKNDRILTDSGDGPYQ